MTATASDLDALLDALEARARARAEATPLRNVAGDEVTPYASTGRLSVNPGDTIASVWGNTTFDQTMEVFDTAAARDTQWPTPKDGAQAYTLDTQSPWLRQSGIWKAARHTSSAGGAPAANIAYTTANVDHPCVTGLALPKGANLAVNGFVSINQGTSSWQDYYHGVYVTGSTIGRLVGGDYQLTFPGGGMGSLWIGSAALGAYFAAVGADTVTVGFYGRKGVGTPTGTMMNGFLAVMIDEPT
jgi:hypothetical protein